MDKHKKLSKFIEVAQAYKTKDNKKFMFTIEGHTYLLSVYATALNGTPMYHVQEIVDVD